MATSTTTSSSTISPALRLLFLLYFASHIPITLLIDAQAFSTTYHPQAAQDLLSW